MPPTYLIFHLMFFRFAILLFTLIASIQLSFSQVFDYQIFVTTPGYTSIRSYSKETFPEIKRDFHIMNGPVSVVDSLCSDSVIQVKLQIGSRKFLYYVTPDAPFVRLTFDRNRRRFSGIGCNFADQGDYCYVPPTFNGMSLSELPKVWLPDINRRIDDRTSLKRDSATVFVIEADIDENGMIHRIVPLSDTLFQYSKVIIDQIYDKAVRGWHPASRNGVPFRALVQMKFELKK